MAPKIAQSKAPNQKIAEAQVNQRRALGDIGNIVADVGGKCNLKEVPNEKKLPPITRPVTRNYSAQVLANAQAASKKEVKNEVIKEEKVAVRGNRGRRTTKKEEEVPPTVIVVSDSDDDVDRTETKQRTKHHASTTSATMASRSVAFCKGDTSDDESSDCEDSMPNIDEQDADNHLAVVEYVEDIYQFYRKTEHASSVRDYMGSQTEINDKMRAILIDWLQEVHLKFELQPETLYLTINILDRYLAMQPVERRYLQLVGITAMLVASKYEEIWAPEVNDFVCVSDDAYTSQQVLQMEKKMLNKLKFHLTIPTPYMFLVRFLKAAKADTQEEHLAYFLLELSMTQYVTIKFIPSVLAAAAVYAARCTLKRIPMWSDLLRRHTGYSEKDIKECASMLATFHQQAPESRFKLVYKKYSLPQFESVALIRPAKISV